MEEFLKNFKSVRDMQTLVPSRDKGLPPELHQQAKELVRLQQHKYSELKIYEIIVLNLKAGKKVDNIKQGLFSISKYPLCLFLDQERPEFHQIRTFSGYYTYEIKEQMGGFEPILEAMGYRYDKQTQLFKLDKDIRLNPGFDDKIALIGCELLLAYEELNLFQEVTKDSNYDPIKHFTIFIQPSQNPSIYSPPFVQQDQYPIQHEHNVKVNPINTRDPQLNPYPDTSYPPINMNNPGNMAGRPLPHPPGHQTGQAEEPEVDMYSRNAAHGTQVYNQPHGNSKLDERGLPQGLAKDSRFDAYSQPGMMDQRNASPQNINIDQRDLGGVGTVTPRYSTISTVNQGKQDTIPTEMGNYGDRGQNYLGGPQDMNQVTGRGMIGKQHQVYPVQRHDMNPHGSRDGMGVQDQGFLGQHQDMNPQDPRNVIAPQHQGQRQDTNPQDPRDIMAAQHQGSQGQYQGIQGKLQDTNPQDPRYIMAAQHQGSQGQYQGFQGQRQDTNPQDPRDIMAAQHQGSQGQYQGFQGQRQDTNPQDPRDIMAAQHQGFQPQHHDINQVTERDVMRGQVQGPQVPQGRTEYNHITNTHGELENIPKPAIGPKPTASSGTNPGSANINPRPHEGSLPCDVSPAHLDCYEGKPLSIHSETPRELPMRTNEADLPSLALREQQANANVNVSTNSDPFQSQAFEKQHNSGLHGTIPTADTEKRISQEQQHLSGEQKHFSGHQDRFSGQHKSYIETMNMQDTNYYHRASEHNLVTQPIDSPPYQPLHKQISENTYPGVNEQRGGAIPPAHFNQQQCEQGIRFDETQMPYGGNPGPYRQEYVQDQPIYNQQAMYNDNYQRPLQEQNIRPNLPPADINQRMQNMYIKDDMPPPSYQYQDPQHGQMGDFRQNQRGDPIYNLPQEQYRQEMPAIEPYPLHPVPHYKPAVDQRPYPTDNPVLYNQPFKGDEFEDTRATRQVYNAPPAELGRYPYDQYNDDRQQAPYMHGDENMPFPLTRTDFSRPVGPNPNPRDPRERPDLRYPEAPQRGGQEAYNTPEMYPGQIGELDYYGQNPPPTQQPQLPDNPRQYGDPRYPPRQEYNDEFHRMQDMERRMDLPEDRFNMHDRIARFQNNPTPAPIQQQRVSDKPWNCPHCTIENKADRRVCEMCSKTPDFELAPNQAVPTHKRMCPFCKELNSIDARACLSCGRNFLPTA